tara:strand:+ start:284 stop:634 length:351 start_codon:yes stop_codon:yes gene_type:complete
MATDFQTREQRNLPVVANIVDLTSAYTAGEATVHAIYVSNKDASNIVNFYLQLADGDNAEKAYILYNVEIPPQSSMIVEKPINLTASTEAASQRKLRVYASSADKLDAVASVLVIT